MGEWIDIGDIGFNVTANTQCHSAAGGGGNGGGGGGKQNV